MGMELEPDSFFQCQYYVGLSWIYCKLVKGDKKKSSFWAKLQIVKKLLYLPLVLVFFRSEVIS